MSFGRLVLAFLISGLILAALSMMMDVVKKQIAGPAS